MYCLFTGESVKRYSQMQLGIVRIMIISIASPYQGNRAMCERIKREYRIRGCQKKLSFLVYIYPMLGSYITLRYKLFYQHIALQGVMTLSWRGC